MKFDLQQRFFTFSYDGELIFTELEKAAAVELSKELSSCEMRWTQPFHIDGDWQHALVLWQGRGQKVRGLNAWREHTLHESVGLWVELNRVVDSFLGRRFVCAVVGCKETSKRFSPEVQEQAFNIGAWAAQCGYTLLTGGLSGVMSKAAEGARSVDGRTAGLLPGTDKADANPYIQEVFPTGIGIARNYQMALGCDVMIAVNGGRGTMEEMCFALDFDKPVLSWGSWELDEVQMASSADEVQKFLIGNQEARFARVLS